MAVYTCTLNLAIDLFIETDEMKPFQVNRTKDDDIQANGKGVNVSLIMKKLGIDSTALGFKAGFTCINKRFRPILFPFRDLRESTFLRM